MPKRAYEEDKKMSGSRNEAALARREKRRARGHVAHFFAVQPIVIQSFERPRNVVNHSYRDFSRVPRDINFPLPDPETDLASCSFPQKLHWFVSHPKFGKCVEWKDHGRAFRFSVPTLCEPHFYKLFGCRRYPVVLTVLSSYGFKHITKGPDRNCFYHELFLRDKPHLTVYFPAPRNPRRLVQDPKHEPNFYEIDAKYPLEEPRALEVA